MEWANVPGGLDAPTPETFADKLVFVNCFQSWCAGCHSEGIPLHKAVNLVYENEPDYVGLYMQTVFEGYSTNTFQNGLNTLVNDHDIVDPFYAHHPGEPPESPHFMQEFDVGGTPWSVLFGRDGELIVSFVSYDYSYYELQDMIDAALAE
jgi:thiol-disulfide isomerase/thioredoxin